MSPRLRHPYRQTVAAVTAVLLGAVTAWAVGTGVAWPLTALAALATAFFVGCASPRVYEAVPSYQRLGTFALGIAALAALALGHRAEFVVGLLVVGAASGIDLAVGLLRDGARRDDSTG